MPLFFTEQFSNDETNDLSGMSLLFTTIDTYDHYAGCTTTCTALPTDPTGGTPVNFAPNADDGYEAITLADGATVSLYGVDYDTMYVCSNGYITFTQGTTSYAETIAKHFSLPRIAGLYDDLSPDDAGTLSWKQLDDRVAVTWENVPEWWDWSSQNTFQIEMFFNGEIHITWLSIDAHDGIIGLSEGDGIPLDYLETDMSAAGPCDEECPADCTGDGVVDVLDLLEVLSQWGGSGSADITGDGIVDVLDLLEVLSAWGPC